MCGIIAAVSVDGRPVNELVLEQFEDQKHRGTRGFGAAMLLPSEEWDKNESIKRIGEHYLTLEQNIENAKEEDKPFWQERLDELKKLVTKVTKASTNPEEKPVVSFMLNSAAPEQIVRTLRSTGEIKTILDLYLNKSNLVLFHHRMPTSSENLCSQTHPILISNPMLKYDYLIAHNGVIHNEYMLKKKHEELGFQYSTEIKEKTTRNFNDSEVIATEIALKLEGLKDEVEASGSAAIIGIRLTKGTRKPLTLFYGRNDGNPLKASRNNHYIFISSEGRGEAVDASQMTFIDLTTKEFKQTTESFRIPTYTYPTTANYQNRIGFQTEESQIALPQGVPHGGQNVIERVGETTGRHYYETVEEDKEAGTAKDEEDENEFKGEFDWLEDRAEMYFEELETILSQFIEAICDPNEIDSTDKIIEEMNKTMTRISEEMKNDHINAMAIEEAKEGNVTVSEEQ